MAIRSHDHDFSPVIDAAQRWVRTCLIEDGSVFTDDISLWTASNLERFRAAFVEQPDTGPDDFLTKLERQLRDESPAVHCLAAEMYWALQLFPSNVRPSTKRSKFTRLWKGPDVTDHALLSDDVLAGIGSAGTAYSSLIWRELEFAIAIALALKAQPSKARATLLTDYDAFTAWLPSVPRSGHRQFRHVLRYLCFPECVERITSKSTAVQILTGLGVASAAELRAWDDRRLDEALLDARGKLALQFPGRPFDFFDPAVVARWKSAPDIEEVADRVHETAEPYVAGSGTGGALNQILYGPPGTGKTYRAIRMAVGICSGEPLDDGVEQAEVTERFEALRAAGQVALVTFHQSTSYEDFVEGLRPSVDARGALTYAVQPGVFRSMCEAAAQAGARSVSAKPIGGALWKMSLGEVASAHEGDIYRQCVDANRIALGFGWGFDFRGCDDPEAIRARLAAGGVPLDKVGPNVRPVQLFKNTMRVGDIVVVTKGNLLFRAIARVVGEYEPPLESSGGEGVQSISRWQTRKVEWRWRDDAGLPAERLSRRGFVQRTIYPLDANEIHLDVLQSLISGSTPMATRNHVVIIDEINRGNVARILGELITCIEKDRRLGGPEETRVQLTYSGQHFGVPGNLYLIGTMNTADRSIAFLDSALRRRFRFVHVKPVVDLVRQRVGEVDGIDVASVLEGINARLAVLLDEDQQLGHSYFLGVETAEDLRNVFVEQIIPLLREQFHGDDVRWCQALGCGFDVDTGKQTTQYGVLLSTSVSLGRGPSAESRTRVTVNPAFRTATGGALAPFFATVAGDA